MAQLYWLIFFASVAFQIRVIAALCREAYKQYPFVFVYSIILLLTTVADRAVVVVGVFSLSKAARHAFFYRDEAVRQFLLFVVVVSLIERTMVGRSYQTRVRVLLAVSAVFSVLVSVYVHWDVRLVLLMTGVIRDVSFGSVVLTLLLWLMLISSRHKDRQLLMVTGALGLQFTAEAIGQALRQLSEHHRSLLITGNLLGALCHVLRLYVWSEAFRKFQEPQTRPDGKSQAIPHPVETLLQSTSNG